MLYPLDGGESCSYPEYIQNTTWRDNTKGRVTYGVNTMEGWAFTAFSQLISDWECFLSDNHFIVSRSEFPWFVFGAGWKMNTRADIFADLEQGYF